VLGISVISNQLSVRGWGWGEGRREKGEERRENK